ncbi:hypothetical protein PM082_018458 [Marasmius tenuissimus]|nr:hypothetical protein PM082_018458 [Marasmius tenuissimus]
MIHGLWAPLGIHSARLSEELQMGTACCALFLAIDAFDSLRLFFWAHPSPSYPFPIFDYRPSWSPNPILTRSLSSSESRPIRILTERDLLPVYSCSHLSDHLHLMLPRDSFETSFILIPHRLIPYRMKVAYRVHFL